MHFSLLLCTTCTAQHIVFDMSTVIIFGVEHNIKQSLFNILYLDVTSSLFGAKILFIILFSNTLNLSSSSSKLKSCYNYAYNSHY
jgi:hypothetical protein